MDEAWYPCVDALNENPLHLSMTDVGCMVSTK
jgi:hypothetical protein